MPLHPPMCYKNISNIDRGWNIFRGKHRILNKLSENIYDKVSISRVKRSTKICLLTYEMRREFLMRRANKSKSVIDWDNFIKKRNQVTKVEKQTHKQEYLNILLSEDAKRPKQLWKALKTLVPGGKSSTTSVKRLVY